MLFIFTTRGLVLVEFNVAVDAMRIKAVARGELFNPIRHKRHHEIKAITHEGLEVIRHAGTWSG